MVYNANLHVAVSGDTSLGSPTVSEFISANNGNVTIEAASVKSDSIDPIDQQLISLSVSSYQH